MQHSNGFTTRDNRLVLSTLRGMAFQAFLLPALLVATATAAENLVFERDVRPVLKAYCWHCHGEEAEIEAGLDLRLKRFIEQGGDSGPAIQPGDAAASLLFQRIASGDMPPGEVKVPAADLKRLADWIDRGAKTAREEPEELAVGDIFTAEDREHWAFQPIVRPAVPDVPAAAEVHNPIDAFLWVELRRQGLDSFSPRADKTTLLRRLSIGLTGLPPSPELVRDFLADQRGDAYERLVNQLLHSPAYGERWGRHWLDVAGYAESDGYAEKDPVRPWAWKYRDYVISAFNQDKAWDTFIIEQLAGDELVSPPYENLQPDQAEKLIATGFLRMAPDGTTDPGVDQMVARNDVIAETIKIVSTALTGLTVGCAQCHAHRYDPISHVDYHRIRAIFEPAYDWENWRTASSRLVSQWSDEVGREAASIDKKLKQLADDRLAELDVIVAETFERELEKLPEELQESARVARETPAAERDAQQQTLIKQYPFLNVNRGTVYLYLPDRLRGFKQKWDKLQAETRQLRPADDWIRCLTEIPGQVPDTKLFARGDIQQPRQTVAPGELAILTDQQSEIPLDDPQLLTSGRRLAYARHLASGQHPLVARVLVNRFWMLHFGTGLVATAGDFGILGQPPSHPELLDWLADEFVRSGWSLKHMQRLLTQSRAYRQVSLRTPRLDAVDPENRLLARMSVRRLDAEVVRDAILSVSGDLSAKLGGPSANVAPDEVGQIVIAADNRDSAGRPRGQQAALGEDEFRRSVYVQVRRSMPLGMLEPFDLPDLEPNCQQRVPSTVAPQSLMMLNSPQVLQRTEAMADRLLEECGAEASAAEWVRRAWVRVFACEPTDSERLAAERMLAAQTQHFRDSLPAGQDSVDGGESIPDRAAEAAALATLCHALVSSNRFLYLD